MSSSPQVAEIHQIRCPACGVANRVPQEKIDRGLAPVCGRCKSSLPLPASPVTVTDATFDTEVQNSSLPVLIDFWAPWCGPCRMVAPMIDQLASEMAGRVRFAKVNVDENPVTARRFNVASIPTLVVTKQGREIDRIVGVRSQPEIASRLERLTPQGN